MTHNAIAQTYIKLKEYKKAKEHFMKILDIEPSNKDEQWYIKNAQWYIEQINKKIEKEK